jgi:hypothetical protein
MPFSPSIELTLRKRELYCLNAGQQLFMMMCDRTFLPLTFRCLSSHSVIEINARLS